MMQLLKQLLKKKVHQDFGIFLIPLNVENIIKLIAFYLIN